MRFAHKPSAVSAFRIDSAAGTLAVSLQKGPFQNNGATPWSAPIGIGTPSQALNIAIDTGTNLVWVTSSLCETSPKGCAHWGGGEFKIDDSTSFRWISQTPQQVSFGPWGSMTVETGSDVFDLPEGDTVRVPIYVAAEYSGTQFKELDWDGGIGMPSGSQWTGPDMGFFFGQMVADGYVSADSPYFTFMTDPATRTGSVIFGGFDPDAADLDSWLYLPFSPYTALAGVEYIWTTPLASYALNGQVMATDAVFCLDSGSSQFKGDDNIMNMTLMAIAASGSNNPTLELTVGVDANGKAGRLLVPPGLYNVTIEEGEGKGTVVPQFMPLGCPTLVLVGSVLMDELVTVFEYRADGTNYIALGMHIFNKKGGQKIIQNGSSLPAEKRQQFAGGRK